MEERLQAAAAVGPTAALAPVAPSAAAPGRAPEEQEAAGPADAGESASGEATAATPSADEPAPWPDDAAESAFLSEQRDTVQPATAAQGGKDVEAEADAAEPAASALPPMQSLIDRIPPEARETLEDLFRAKFVSVRRVPKKALKPAS